MPLDNRLQGILQELFERYGPFSSSDDDVRRCRGLLRDLANAYTLEVNLLLRALEIGALEQLRRNQLGLAAPRLAQTLQETHGLSVENAQWAIDTWAAALHVPGATKVPFPSPVAFDWVPIPAGAFLMGSDPKVDRDARDDEVPRHTVYLSEFSITRTPVTNAQYLTFVNATGQPRPEHWPSWYTSDATTRLSSEFDLHPVVWVSWVDAHAFCA